MAPRRFGIGAGERTEATVVGDWLAVVFNAVLIDLALAGIFQLTYLCGYNKLLFIQRQGKSCPVAKFFMDEVLGAENMVEGVRFGSEGIVLEF